MARDITDRVAAPGLPGTYGGQAVRGRMVWSPLKIAWFALFCVPAVLFAVPTAAPGPVAAWLGLSVLSLCGGHSLGMHRWLIHESFDCPQWLGVFGVWLGTLTGLGGPETMMRTHDLRDWAQRQADCHPFFSQNAPIALDTMRQIGARFHVEGAAFRPSARLRDSRALRLLQRTSMLQNGFIALALFALGGLPYVIWGVCVRVTVSMLGHSLVGWFAHNRGPGHFHVPGASVQGHDVPGPRIPGVGGLFGLITFGECWHNNHHAFPESAKLGVMPGQPDPGWWVLKALERVGLVWDVVEADVRKGCGCEVGALHGVAGNAV